MKLIKFEKPGCEPCIQLDQYLKDKGIEPDQKVNPYEDVEMAIQYSVNHVPTLILVNSEGKELKRVIGSVERNPKRIEHLLMIRKMGEDSENFALPK